MASTETDTMFRPVTTESDEEFMVLAHLRGWCHLGSLCALCKAQDATIKVQRTLDQIISG